MCLIVKDRGEMREYIVPARPPTVVVTLTDADEAQPQ